MPKELSNRDAKRQEIIYKAYEFIIKFGIKEFSTNAFIKYFKIGKSSLYHYFTSKDEILYELYYNLALDSIKKAKVKIENSKLSLKETLEIVFDFYLGSSSENLRQQQLYIEFLYIYSAKKTENMEKYDEYLMEHIQSFLKEILEAEISKGHIYPNSIDLVNSMLVTADGMLLYSFSLKNFNLEREFRLYLNTTLELIERKA